MTPLAIRPIIFPILIRLPWECIEQTQSYCWWIEKFKTSTWQLHTPQLLEDQMTPLVEDSKLVDKTQWPLSLFTKMIPRIPWRYAPMSRDHIPGFPHKMPQVNWDDNLPVFQGEKFDNPLWHIIKFHIHVWSLNVEWNEDCLMKMFMLTLEGKARDWYEWLKSGSLFSLKDLEICVL